jgi:hypothetical protein
VLLLPNSPHTEAITLTESDRLSTTQAGRKLESATYRAKVVSVNNLRGWLFKTKDLRARE